MAHPQPEHGDERPAGRGGNPQLSLVIAPPEPPQDAVWLTACAWCNRINVRGRWLEAPAALALFGTPAPRLTHGICPACFAEASRRRDRV